MEEWVRPRGVAATAWTGFVVARAPRLWYLGREFMSLYIQGVSKKSQIEIYGLCRENKFEGPSGQK